jgi:hypothetical protein
MVHNNRIRLLAGVLFVTAAIAACRDLSTMPEDGRACSTTVYLGSFRGRAAGEASDTLMGCAFFTTDTMTREFGMVLTNGAPNSLAPMIKLFRKRAPVPGTIYQINIGRDSVWGVMFLANRRFSLSTGTFKVLPTDRSPYSSTWFIEGKPDVTATDTLGATLSVSGVFKGVCVGVEENLYAGTDPIAKKSKACDQTFAALRAEP